MKLIHKEKERLKLPLLQVEDMMILKKEMNEVLLGDILKKK